MANSPTKDPMRELDRGLLERGRLALATLQYQEQAARYRAAYATLLEAISEAEQGNDSRLRVWLDQRIAPTTTPIHSSPLDPSTLDSHGTVSNLMVATTVELAPKQPGYTQSPESPDLTHHRNDRSHEHIASPSLPGGLFGTFDAAAGYPWKTSTTSSPWAVMELAAKERLLHWSPPNANSPAAKTDRAPDPRKRPSKTLHRESLAKPNPKTKRRRIASPDIWVSILVHGCLLVLFSFWVIAVTRPSAGCPSLLPALKPMTLSSKHPWTPRRASMRWSPLRSQRPNGLPLPNSFKTLKSHRHSRTWRSAHPL